MAWDGIDRRCMGQRPFCEQHIGIVEKLSAIFTTVTNIESKLVEDTGFKHGVFLSFMSIVVILVIQIACFAYLFGQQARQVSINTERLNVIEKLHYDQMLKGIKDPPMK